MKTLNKNQLIVLLNTKRNDLYVIFSYLEELFNKIIQR